MIQHPTGSLSSPIEQPSSSDDVKGTHKSQSPEDKVSSPKIKVESTDDEAAYPDHPPRSTSPPQRIAARKRPHSVDSPFFSQVTGRWGRDSLLKRVKPDPLEVMCKAFPGHGRDVLERILQGCGGNVVQAIECILENEGPAPLHAPIPIMPNPVPPPPVIYSGYPPQNRILRNAESLPLDDRMAVQYHRYSHTSRARDEPAEALMAYARTPTYKHIASDSKPEETGSKSKYDMKKVYCTNCGHKFQENDNFCGNCGQRIT